MALRNCVLSSGISLIKIRSRSSRTFLLNSPDKMSNILILLYKKIFDHMCLVYGPNRTICHFTIELAQSLVLGDSIVMDCQK